MSRQLLMAEAAVKQEYIQVCPICAEEYRDARVLKCGHHFCKVCLEEIATGHPDGHVTCPSCHHITKTVGKDDVMNLPKYRTVNDFVGLVNCAVERKCGNFKCQFCTEMRVKAAKICFGCPALLCSTCSVEHQQLSSEENNHSIYDISPYAICEKHSNSSPHLNVILCVDCRELCCPISAFKEHRGHTREPVELEGARLKTKIRENKLLVQRSAAEIDYQMEVLQVLEDVKKAKADFNASVEEIRTAMEELQEKLSKIETECNIILDWETKHLEMIVMDLGDYMTSKRKLVSHLERLEQSASNQEIIKTFTKLPKYDPAFHKKLIIKDDMKIPIIYNIKDMLNECKEAMTVQRRRYSLNMNQPERGLREDGGVKIVEKRQEASMNVNRNTSLPNKLPKTEKPPIALNAVVEEFKQTRNIDRSRSKHGWTCTSKGKTKIQINKR